MADSLYDIHMLVRSTVLSSSANHAQLGGKTLNETVGGRVFVAATIDADASSMEMPCLIIDPVGGGEANFSLQLDTARVHVYAYDDSAPGESVAIYEAFASVCQAARLADDNVGPKGTGYETERPVSGHNSVMKSWFTRGTWSFTLAG